MTDSSTALLSDRELLDATARAADCERRTTAELIRLLAELDARKLYLSEGYSSLFNYVTLALHLSEPAAYSRITAARAVRRFPVILTMLAQGVLTLTTIGLLSAHLTDENHEALLDAARHKGKRDVERLAACLYPQPDIGASSVRKVPAPARSDSVMLAPVLSSDAESGPAATAAPTPAALAPVARDIPSGAAHRSPVPTPAPERDLLTSSLRAHRSLLAPLAPDRYLLRVTLSQDAHDKLERARALLRHTLPHGDPAAVIDRALTVLLEQLERTRQAATSRPRGHRPRKSRTRHVPAVVRRAVWSRDEGRCAFVGTHERCSERAFLEFHHVQPFADGGATDVGNLQLRCRAHNAYEAARYFGEDRLAGAQPSGSTPSGRS